MGSSSWSDDHYVSRTADRSRRGVDAFEYSDKIRSGQTAAKVHESLNPFGKNRESRDSEAHPESTAIAVIFDVTGSMHRVPHQMQKKLPKLMELLLQRGYIKDPQVLFGAVGDYYSDHGSIQIGQFESGIEMDNDLTNMWLEGGGGGSYEESYQNAIYFMAHHTSIDCLEKRNKKGYLFLIGDEKPYPKCTKAEIARLFGDDVPQDLPIKDVIAEAQKKYHIFFVIPSGTSHYSDPVLKKTWVDLLGGENVIMLQDPSLVCESIGLSIALIEGTAGDMAKDLEESGVSKDAISVVTGALDALAKSKASGVSTGT
jgi:hypothetical protein